VRKAVFWIPIVTAICVFSALVLTGCKTSPDSSTNPQTAEANQSAAPLPVTMVQSNRTFPILFLVGDSTVHNSASGLKGWGDVIGAHFDSARIKVENRARAGRSSRTFQTQGWWRNLLASARPGDTIPGLGEEATNIVNQLTHKPEIVHTYGWYMRKYITDALSIGMTPVICSPVPRLPKQTVRVDTAETNSYVTWSREIASRENVPFIDLNRLILGRYVGLTPAEIKAKYFTSQDNTHFNPAGARLNAECVVEGLRKLTNRPLARFLSNKPSGLISP
jgi:rhamnogalacturonan acetylesterase